MEVVMQVWLAAEVQLLSVSGFPSDIPIAANPLHRETIWRLFSASIVTWPTYSPLPSERWGCKALRSLPDAGSLREPFGLLPIPGRR